MTNVELRLAGTDLLDDPSLRHGLVNLWQAEAETAGLESTALRASAAASATAAATTLAELSSGGDAYVAPGDHLPARPDPSCVHADRPTHVVPPSPTRSDRSFEAPARDDCLGNATLARSIGVQRVS